MFHRIETALLLHTHTLQISPRITLTFRFKFSFICCYKASMSLPQPPRRVSPSRTSPASTPLTRSYQPNSPTRAPTRSTTPATPWRPLLSRSPSSELQHQNDAENMTRWGMEGQTQCDMNRDLRYSRIETGKDNT